VVVALAPVGDSDDSDPIWLARCARWQRDLEARIGRAVQLDRLGDRSAASPGAQASPREQDCLASVAWRYVE